MLYSPGNHYSYNVVILVKKSLKYERAAAYIDLVGRILLIEIKRSYKVFVIGNVYAST